MLHTCTSSHTYLSVSSHDILVIPSTSNTCTPCSMECTVEVIEVCTSSLIWSHWSQLVYTMDTVFRHSHAQLFKKKSHFLLHTHFVAYPAIGSRLPSLSTLHEKGTFFIHNIKKTCMGIIMRLLTGVLDKLI